MLGCDHARQSEARRVRRDAASCSSTHSLTERAPTPIGSNCWTSSTSARSTPFDGDDDVGRKRRADRLEVVGEIAVVIDRVDDGLTDRAWSRVEVLELELPQQVVAQCLLGAVGVFERRRRLGALRQFPTAPSSVRLPTPLARDRELGEFLGSRRCRLRVAVGAPAPSVRPRLGGFRGLGRRLLLLDLEHHVLVERGSGSGSAAP